MPGIGSESIQPAGFDCIRVQPCLRHQVCDDLPVGLARHIISLNGAGNAIDILQSTPQTDDPLVCGIQQGAVNVKQKNPFIVYSHGLNSNRKRGVLVRTRRFVVK